MARMKFTSRGVVLPLAALYFLVPIGASIWFSVNEVEGVSFDAYTKGLGAEGLTTSLMLSVRLGLATIVCGLLLMVPTLVAVVLYLPRLRRIVESSA